MLFFKMEDLTHYCTQCSSAHVPHAPSDVLPRVQLCRPQPSPRGGTIYGTASSLGAVASFHYGLAQDIA